MRDIKPEEEVELKLWDWLKTKSKYVKDVYFNRKNILNSPVFTTTGVNKKPDFVIKINRGFKEEYIAVEIKDNKKSKQVYDAGKILHTYYNNYIKGLTKYFINNKEIKINHFTIATQDSINGHIFKKEQEIKIIDNLKNTDNDQWRKTLALYKLEPRFEYHYTSGFVRNLFNQFKDFRKENNLKESGGPSIGILMSDINGEGIIITDPHLFIMNYNSHLKKPKWGTRYWRI